MGGPHPPAIRLRPDPVLSASILVAHLAAGLALFLMDLPLAVTASSGLAVAVSAAWTVHAQARKRGLALVLAADGALRICHEGDEGGGDAWARVLPGAVVFPTVVWFALGWTGQDGRSRRLRLMLIAAEVDKAHDGKESGERGDHAQWRRLRTWLRHRAPRPLGP
ncbi:MAG: hypothetical protein LBK55_10835 [Azoarcus sp.]|jgi:hypothetical protein|nr:hypothetical protein [Azoarcus sp.]